MNIEKIFNIVSTLESCGMNICVISPIDGGKMLISGIDDDGMIAVYHKTQNSSTIDSTMGVRNLETFMKKMKLIDLTNSKISEDVVENDGISYSKSIVMKEGRKKVTHSFANPDKLETPISQHPSLVTVIVQLDNEATVKLRKAISTFLPKNINIKADGTELTISFVDSDGDKYTDVIGETDKHWSFEWKKEKFVKLLDNVTDKEIGSSFGITDAGLMYFMVNDINVLLAPVTE